MTVPCQAHHGGIADSFQAYCIVRRVGRAGFPHVSTVMWPSPQVRIHFPYVGGGFGAKELKTEHLLAILLADIVNIMGKSSTDAFLEAI